MFFAYNYFFYNCTKNLNTNSFRAKQKTPLKFWGIFKYFILFNTYWAFATEIGSICSKSCYNNAIFLFFPLLFDDGRLQIRYSKKHPQYIVRLRCQRIFVP